jgi:eukaryotic-like serine/threonine-protein kinase
LLVAAFRPVFGDSLGPVVTRSGLVLDARYRLDERIAAGGVGQVWRAEDLLLERPVAVKVLRPEYADHPETLQRFQAEARHAGSLTHPCIAQVYDYGHAGPDGPPYLVMEFVNGPSLADVLVIEPVEAALALDVIAQAATGLGAAHRSGLVHRDVKPANILIGPDGLVKITDFGVAHVVGSASVTAPGVLMGTTQYIAPERITGGPSTPASDLYSLGIVIYECLTGMPPYEGTPAEVMTGHLYLPLPPLPAGVPPELDELVARLTAKNPAARLADAGELAALAGRLRDVIAAGGPGSRRRLRWLPGPGAVRHPEPGPPAVERAKRVIAATAAAATARLVTWRSCWLPTSRR